MSEHWWRIAAERRPPSVASMQVVAVTTGSIYLVGGACVLLVALLDPPAAHRLWLTLLPVAALMSGVVTLRYGARWPRWVYHGCVLSGNALVTAEIVLGHGTPVVGATMPIYLFVVVDAAFFFPLVGLAFHLAHVLIVTIVLLPRVGVPWQTLVTFDGVCVGIAIVLAWLCRAADAAEQDPVTHLANRRGLDRRLEECVERATGAGLCLVLVDLDGFKAINDAQGHQRGDELLAACAQQWNGIVPSHVLLGRFGGDEFAAICHNMTLGEAADLADGLRAALPSGITASAGVAAWSQGDSASMLMSRADVALYDAKSSGRDQTAVYGDPSRAAKELEGAIARGEMVLHYQPVLRLSDRQLVGVEALVRWQHPTRGLVPPLGFVPQAERNGAIHALGIWALTEACRAVREHAPTLAAVAVNVSIHELRRPDYAETVCRILDEQGLSPTQLVLEITEGVYDEGDPQVAINLRSVRNVGVRIAIDDFGSGYSSLRWLDRLPLDVIKIDGSFIDGIREGVREVPVLEAVVAIARSLGARVIAERVETEQQAQVLTDIGCGYAQGYLFGRPVPSLPVLTTGPVGPVTATSTDW